jgi:hypothetical protein
MLLSVVSNSICLISEYTDNLKTVAGAEVPMRTAVQDVNRHLAMDAQ